MQIIGCHRVPVLSSRPSPARCARTARRSLPLTHPAPRSPGSRLARCARHFAQGARSCAVLRHAARANPLSHASCYCASHYALSAARAVPSPPRAKRPAPCAAPRCAQCYASCLESVLLRCCVPAATRLTALRSREALRQVPCCPVSLHAVTRSTE